MSEGVTVRTSYGRIRGITRRSKFSGTEYYSFLGIPYALPPVGKLRFKPPQPVPRWRDVYDATYHRDDCAQYSYYMEKFVGSEDCLYLNVHIPKDGQVSSSHLWTPGKDDALKAVVVLIHLGGLVWGSGSTKVNGSPTYIMHRDIVYVTFNYRLHVLGFLNLDIPECSGNFGLKDVVAVLQWVQHNIKSFGGDPNNVTVLGSSSGAMLAHCLMMIPQTKGLFHKAIALSGYTQLLPINFHSNYVERAYELGKLLNFRDKGLLTLYKFLQSQPLESLMMALKLLDDSVREESKITITCSSFLPAICSIDRFLPNPPSEYVKLTNPVPLIFGFVENEGAFTFIPRLSRYVNKTFATAFRTNCWSWLGKTDDETMHRIEEEVRTFYHDENKKSFPNREREYNILGEITHFFYSSEGKGQIISAVYSPFKLKRTGQDRCIGDAQTDVISAEFYDTWANVMNKFHPDCPVYVYRFEHRGDLNFFTELLRKKSRYNFEGNCHSEDILYWMCRKAIPDEHDRPVVETMTKLFSNFAKTGNPISDDLETKWPNSTIEKPCYLRIDNELVLRDGRVNEVGTQFWQNLKMKYSKRGHVHDE